VTSNDSTPSHQMVQLSEEDRERMRDLDTAASSIIKEMGEIVARALYIEIMDTTRFTYRPEITRRGIKLTEDTEWAVVCNGTVCGFWDPSTGTCHE
jgi:hypothetical protein